MLLLDAPSTGKPINIFNTAEHNEGLPDDDGSSDDFDNIPSQHTHTHTLSETSLSKSNICMQF